MFKLILIWSCLSLKCLGASTFIQGHRFDFSYESLASDFEHLDLTQTPLAIMTLGFLDCEDFSGELCPAPLVQFPSAEEAGFDLECFSIIHYAIVHENKFISPEIFEYLAGVGKKQLFYEHLDFLGLEHNDGMLSCPLYKIWEDEKDFYITVAGERFSFIKLDYDTYSRSH